MPGAHLLRSPGSTLRDLLLDSQRPTIGALSSLSSNYLSLSFVHRGSTVSVISAFPLPAGVRHPAAVFQSLSYVQLFASPWTPACQAPQSFTISQSLLKFMSIESVMSSPQGMRYQLSHPLSFPSPLAFNLSQNQGLFK